MMISYKLGRGLMVGIGLLGIFGADMNIAAQSNSPVAATVVRLHGNARFSNDNKTWQPLKKGALLNTGAIIQTAENSTVDLNLNPKATSDESLMRVQADTVLGIDRLAATGPVQDIELDLRTGQIAAHVGRLQPGSRYEVKFSNGIAGIRNGDFRMTASGVVAVQDGEAVVVVVGADGTPSSHSVSAGKQFNAATGTFTDVSKIPADQKKPLAKPTPTPEPVPANALPKANGTGGALRKF